MRAVRYFLAVGMLMAVSAASALAQQASGKIGVINTLAFDQEGGGITRYVSAMDNLENEFKPDNQKLQTLATQLETLKTEIDNLQKSQGSNVPVDAKTVNAKIEQYNALAREAKFQQENLQARVNSRRQVVMAPIFAELGKAMQEYADQNGFSIILDAARLDNAGLILAFDRKLDVTDDFIKFFNARPAGTASTRGASQ